ncbi:MAG: XrtA-associated tyrosine autokinase [Gammaproteobacteria bacterium]
MSIVEKAIDKLQSTQPSKPTHRPAKAGKGKRPRARTDANTLVIDEERLQAAGVLPPKEQRHRTDNEFRSIKRPILAHAFGKGGTSVPDGNLVMVASCLPGEGKTFAAINLALSVAMERDRTVLVVDADIPKPRLKRIFDLEEARGLTDLLLDESLSVADVLVHTSIPNLKLIPSGQFHHHATELLASERMEYVVREIGHRYPDRLVVFDSPPLLGTAEAQVLAQLMGQIVLVVEADRTSQRAVHDAMEMLDGQGAVNLVLNKCRTSRSDYYASYYGDYQEKRDNEE